MGTVAVFRAARRAYGIVAVIAVASSLTLVIAASAAAGSLTPTRGSIPPAAFKVGGPIDASLVPDFVSALGHNGEVVGYVPKQWLVGGSGLSKGPLTAGNVPVYADDLVTLVGYMVPGRGFVPRGTDPNSVPKIPAQAMPAGASFAP